MRPFVHIILILIAAAFQAACTNDAEQPAPQRVVLSLPIAVCETPTDDAALRDGRSTGDPGVSPLLPAPTFLYIWIDMTDGSSQRRLCFTKEDNIAPSNWQEFTDVIHRWECRRLLELPEGIALKDGTTLQIYAIASQDDLSTNITALNTPLGLTGELPQIVDYTAARLAALQSATFDLASWCDTDAATHSRALGNLYSTPLALMGNGNADATAAGITTDELLKNGTYTVVNNGGTMRLEEVHPTRLYHCAAKADFKWEVPANLQPGVKVQSITLTGLPTQLRVFEPTHNPALGGDHTACSCPLLGASTTDPAPVNILTPGNQWLGREYAYVLQPPTTVSTADGILSYDVTFTGRTPDSKNTLNGLSSPAATNPVFTTWYRVSADIQ